MWIVKKVIGIMAGVCRQDEPKVWRVRIKTERVSRSKLGMLDDLIHVESVHEIGGLSNVDGAWQAALWQTEVVHAARIITLGVGNKCHGTAIRVKRGSREQGKPTIPLMCYSRRLDLHSNAASSLNNLSELREAMALLEPTNREVKIGNATVASNSVKTLICESPLTSKAKCLSHLCVGFAKIQRHMIVAFGMG
ncbi:MAG: hypothetical protein DVB22_000959 [Verrucomicrobia bacterium]|nr:MAG: hypothetical protein DVB22_000959 [Verrucomicrobiota bacterium]